MITADDSSEVEVTEELPIAYITARTATRLRWLPIYMGEGHPYRCSHCHLVKADHILHRYTDKRRDPHLYCPEWRLRQMDGDR